SRRARLPPRFGTLWRPVRGAAWKHKQRGRSRFGGERGGERMRKRRHVRLVQRERRAYLEDVPVPPCRSDEDAEPAHPIANLAGSRAVGLARPAVGDEFDTPGEADATHVAD